MSTNQKVALTIRSVSKSYGDQKVLNQIDLEEMDKEFLILLGPQGVVKPHS